MRQPRNAQSGFTLVELMVGVIIMAVVTTMLLTGWFALQSSFSYSVNSNLQRDNARQGLSRMQREIRDAQARSDNSDPALYRARAYWIAFFTTFNEAGNQGTSLQPHMVMYRLYRDRELWRFEDNGVGGGTANDGVISGVNMSPSPSDDPLGWLVSEQQTGEGAQLVLANVVNFSGNIPLFRYLYYDSNGILAPHDNAYNASGPSGQNNRTNTVAVLTRMLVDINPGHSPIYADLQVTSQLRNQR